MRKLTIAGSCVTVGIITSFALPAQAGVNGQSSHYESGNSHCSDNLRNIGYFTASTDVVRSHDDCSDGWGAETQIVVSGYSLRTCYNGGGNGTTKSCDYAFAANRSGQILARSVDNGDFRGSGNVDNIIT